MPLIPDKYVFDNPFITGGADAKLGDDRAAACFRIAYAGIEDGKPVSASDFQNHICAPMKQIGAWRKGLLRLFGELAVTPATHRVISFLESPPGLKQVVACLQSSTPLHGSSDADPGITQCHALVKELKKLKEEGVKNATSSIADVAKEKADEAAKDNDVVAEGGSLLALPSDAKVRTLWKRPSLRPPIPRWMAFICIGGRRISLLSFRQQSSQAGGFYSLWILSPPEARSRWTMWILSRILTGSR